MLWTMNYYFRVAGTSGLAAAIKARFTSTPALLKIERGDVRFPIYLRIPSSDVPAFEQVFVRREYDFEVRRRPGVIVDAGANIGLASIFFANTYPEARIVAIEPDDTNFELLERNTAPYKNITPVRGALWHEDATIDLVDPGLGKWGLMTQARDGSEQRLGELLHQVRGMTVDTIMREHGLDHVDIFKIDIEGAEREVFRDSSSWISKVDSLIVELHERMKSGCCRSFYNGTNGFDEEWCQGENVYLARDSGCLARRHT
jgi:FkbM family methyltransferase